MRPKLALIIGGVLAILFGLGGIFAPRPFLAGFGLETPTPAIVLMRDVGTILLSIGVLNILARDATGPGLRAVLIGNVLLQALEIVVNGWELATGELPMAAAPGMIIHVVLGGVFVLALARPDKAF